MVPENMHDFFIGAASVAGALIGLLFVAISVAGDRLNRDAAISQVHRIRANAALIAFTNALAVSLFSLIPDGSAGWTAVAAAGTGLTFILASILSLVRARVKSLAVLRDAVFLIGLAVGFVVQLTSGLDLTEGPSMNAIESIAILVIVFFLLGISRSWELVGGPSIGLRRELAGLVTDELKRSPAARGEGPAGEQPVDGEHAAGHEHPADQAGPPEKG